MAQNRLYRITVDELAISLGQGSDAVLSALDKEDLIRLPGGKWGISPETVREYLSGNGVEYRFKVIAYINLKGGTGKIVEYFGPGLANLSVTDRATLSNMAPEYGATIGYFPIDEATQYVVERVTPDEEIVVLCAGNYFSADMVEFYLL